MFTLVHLHVRSLLHSPCIWCAFPPHWTTQFAPQWIPSSVPRALLWASPCISSLAFSMHFPRFPLGFVLKYARRFSASFPEHAVRWNGLANAWGNPQVMLFLFSVLCAFRCLPFVLHRLSPWSMYKQPCFSSGLIPLPPAKSPLLLLSVFASAFPRAFLVHSSCYLTFPMRPVMSDPCALLMGPSYIPLPFLLRICFFAPL